MRRRFHEIHRPSKAGRTAPGEPGAGAADDVPGAPIRPSRPRPEFAASGGRTKTFREYRALPWTVHGTGCEEGGERFCLITIEELPGFSVVGESRVYANREFARVLDDYLEAAIAAGAVIPKPAPAPAVP